MKEIDINNWERLKNYEWFSKFSDSTYGMNVKMDVTKLVKHVKDKKESFFIDLLFIILNGLNSVDEMRIRLVNDKPVIYDDINPAFTVMTVSNTFKNVRFNNCKNYREFYDTAHECIENAKVVSDVSKDEYNPDNCYNEYYITCVPWVNFDSMTHPISDDKSSQCVPRICWGKYTEKNGKYELTLNITVSHMFVDGYPLAKVFNNIQDLLDRTSEVLK